MGFRETNKHNWGAHTVDIQYLHVQCGAPQLCLLVYKPHEYYRYHKP